jgi:hypothetical protein
MSKSLDMVIFPLKIIAHKKVQTCDYKHCKDYQHYGSTDEHYRHAEVFDSFREVHISSFKN